MTHNAPERHRHNNQRHHHYTRSPVRSYYGVARAASRYNALNVVGSTLARLSPVPLRTTAHPHSSTIPQNIPQKGGHLSRSKSARIKACRYDRLSPRSHWRGIDLRCRRGLWVSLGVSSTWLATDRDRLFDEMRLGIRASGCEPGCMCRRVRAQCPFPADSVDAYRVHGQGTVGLDVQAEKMFEVLVVLGCVPLCSVQAKAVGDPEVARHPYHSSDATHQEQQAEESDQGPHAPKPKSRRQPGCG